MATALWHRRQMAVTTVDYFPTTSTGPHDDAVRSPVARTGSRGVPNRRQRNAASSGWLRAWASTIRWDHVVGFVAAVATVVLIVLSALPAQQAAPVTTQTTPATSVLGATDTTSTSGAGE
jgi:hypothetical protein